MLHKVKNLAGSGDSFPFPPFLVGGQWNDGGAMCFLTGLLVPQHSLTGVGTNFVLVMALSQQQFSPWC